MEEERGTLEHGEPHPCAYIALEYISNIGYTNQSNLREAFSSCTIEGNRFAEVCGETLRRLMDREPVSDRYICGLAVFIMSQEIKKLKDRPCNT